MILNCSLKTWLAGCVGVIGLSVFLKKMLEDKSTKPNVTWIGWLLNVLLWPMFILKPSEAFKPLNLDELKKRAMTKTGLTDFGDWDDRPYREAIELTNNKNYSPLGRFLMYQFFVDRLIVTLKIQNTLKENKTLKEYCDKTKIRRPCFILGMPRTGTTFLHHLLSLDPEVRAPMTYELDYPVPQVPENLKKDKEVRIKHSNDTLKKLELVAPHLTQSHELSATNYEECSHVMVNDVPVRPNTFIFRTKESTEIVFNWNLEKVYKNYYKVLQMLEYFHLKANPSEAEAKRWVLKAPIHLCFIPELIKAFPDADIIWCHRDPAANMISCGTMFRAIEDIFLDKVNLLSMGPAHFQYSNTMFQRADDALTKNPNISCMHVKYSEFVPEPIKMIEQIYKHLGYEFTNKYRTILENYIAADKIKRKELRKNDTRIPVTLDTFGSSQEKMDEELSWYTKKYLSTSMNGTNGVKANGMNGHK